MWGWTGLWVHFGYKAVGKSESWPRMWTLADESEGRKCFQIHSDSVQYRTGLRSPSLWHSPAITVGYFLHSASSFVFVFFLINWNYSSRLKTCVNIFPITKWKLLENYSEQLCSRFSLQCRGRNVRRCGSHVINVPFASLPLAWHTTHTEKRALAAVRSILDYSCLECRRS